MEEKIIKSDDEENDEINTLSVNDQDNIKDQIPEKAKPKEKSVSLN